MTENLKHKRLHSFDDLVIECFKNDKEFAAFSIKSALELLLESFGYRLSIKKIKKPLLNQANF